MAIIKKKVGDLEISELQEILNNFFVNRVNQVPKINEVNDLVSIQEAMLITNLARQTIYGLVFERKIPFIKRPNSKKLFFSRTALLKWIQPDSNEK